MRLKVTNRFKGLNTVNSMPEELVARSKYCTGGSGQNHSKDKEKMAKWLSEEALQIAEERSEKQGRKGKVHPAKCRVPKNSKERQEGLLQ